MTEAEWRRVSEIADELLDVEPAALDGEIERRCGDDARLAEAVRDLLSRVAAVNERSFLAESAQSLVPFGRDPLAAGLCGASIEGFELLRVIAEGGMGIVFEARQRKPERSVAVKVLRPAFATKSSARRFEVEAEILGRLNHDAIARVIASGVHRFEGGALGFDLPWYAMEFLDGARDLLRFAREESLTLDAKLELFARACEGVHHAHLRGVIHRDLKPGNLLVDRRGDPKVIDFGIARATDLASSSLGLATAGTSAFDLLGTLRYMAPEQVDGRADRVDVRTDVYALGVVLCELVTGSAPLEVDRSTLDEAVRVIRAEPPKLPTRIVRHLPRELDWIVDACLAKDPDDRYGSVRELIEDVGRFRRRELLSVGPRDLRYRLSSFVRRNRVGVAIGSAASAVIVSWIASLGAALDRARTAEVEASLRADEANRENAKLTAVRDYFGTAVDQARRSYGTDSLTFRQVLEQLERSLTSHELPPEVAAVLASDIAGFHLDLEDPRRAVELLEPMVERLEQADRSHGIEARRVHTLLARARRVLGDDAAATQHIDVATALRADQAGDTKRAFNATELQVDWERMKQFMANERFSDAERLARTMLSQFEAGAADPMNNAHAIRAALVLALAAMGHYDQAEPIAREALEADRRVFGTDSVRAATTATTLAMIRTQRGAPEDALELLAVGLPILEHGLPSTHRYVLSAHEQRAVALQRLGRPEESLAILEDALPKRRGDGGRWDREALLTASRIGSVLTQMHRFDEAERRLTEAHRESEATLGPDHPLRIVVAGEIGRILVLRGQPEVGIRRIDESIGRLAAVEGDSSRVKKLRTWLEQARNGTLTAEPG